MNINERVEIILNHLEEHYGYIDKCFLNYEEPYQLLIATILSAQCTDDRVNMVTAGLFKKYTSLRAFAEADLAELEQDIKSTGFYHSKARNIKQTAQMILRDYGGRVPEGMDELTKLAGVGRKTANIVRGHIYNIPSVAVDTHVKRVSKKLGLTANTDPDKIEADLMKILPETSWIKFNTQVIAHGRAVCKARNPNCAECFITVCEEKECKE